MLHVKAPPSTTLSSPPAFVRLVPTSQTPVSAGHVPTPVRPVWEVWPPTALPVSRTPVSRTPALVLATPATTWTPTATARLVTSPAPLVPMELPLAVLHVSLASPLFREGSVPAQLPTL